MRVFVDTNVLVRAFRARGLCADLLQLDQFETIEAQRVVDVVSGAVHALEGRSERLGETTFLFAPSGVVLSTTSMPS